MRAPLVALTGRRSVRGLTLVEMMVALAIGLLLVIAMSAIFVSSSSSRREVEMSADVIESGRYGVDVLTRELSQAGYFDTLVTPPGTTNNPCSTNIVQWRASLSIHVAALNNATAAPAAPWDCVTPKEGTDVIFIQRASTCAVGEADCQTENGNNAYIQVSECGEEYSALMPNPFKLAAGGSGTGTFNMQTKACDGATFVAKRKVIRRIYYVSASDVLSYIDILPTLGAQPAVQLAENIEQMQIEYGIAAADSAGSPTSFTASPTAAELPFIVGARVALLARSTVASKNTKNAVSFTLSDDTTVDIAAASSNLKRRVYTTYIPFVTPKSRRESS